MGNLMTSMYTGVSGLLVNQTSINTSAHNLANVDTKGFTRQQILTSDFFYNKIGETANSYMQVGLGTQMTCIRQVRDIFLDKSYRLEIGRQSFYEAQSETVDEIEGVFGELGGEAFKNSVSDLWTAISELSKQPDSIVTRGVLVSTAKTFLQKAGIVSEQLKDYQVNLNKQIQEKVNRINEIGDTIKDLNQRIRQTESVGEQANDYRDARNLLLDELGELVNISYKEDAYGVVNVSVEGVQFVTDDVIYHMETQKTVTSEDQEKTDNINGYIENIAGLIDTMKAASAAPADIEKAVKSSDDWSALSKYGKLKYETGGEITYNDHVAIQADGKVNKVSSKQSDLLTVVWKGNGCGEVFRLNGNYSSAAQTDVGSLKGLLVSRGSYAANYKDIPMESDFASEKDYQAAVKEYNKYVDTSVLMSTQAQFDQLVHGIVKSINDILCPNTDITADSVSDFLSKTTGTDVDPNKVDLTNATVKLKDGTVVKAGDVKIFDSIAAGCGMDDEKTQGEALFERRSVDRYTKGTLTVDIDGVPTDIEVMVYNEEYDSDDYSLFTVEQTVINEKILNNYNLIPLSSNKYSGNYGYINQDVCEQLLDAWDKEGLKLNPNTLTKNNFQDYYDAMTISISYRGKTYTSIVENQSDMVENIDNNRQQVAGVSSEDELTNLIKYQHAYNASSRYINAVNELLNNIIEKLG